MPKIKYKNFNFREKSLSVIDTANDIIREYEISGYDLTLRQLYYQFVARGIIPNSNKEYKNLGGIINDGRLAGLIDWDAIEDRTRPSRGNSHWENPQEIITACSQQFRLDTRQNQDNYIEVWVEKDALVGVLEKVCNELDVPYFSCRGYVSQSSMWEAAQRFEEHEQNGQDSHLIHLGDHDPSGIDMSRDIQERLNLFESDCEVHRIALTMEQIEEYNPPPNPAKLSDSRCAGYIDKFGTESWELDALDPKVITRLIVESVIGLTNEKLRNKQIQQQEKHRVLMKKVVAKWDKIIQNI